MRRLTKVLLLSNVLFASLLAGCGGSSPQRHPLYKTEWRVVNVDGKVCPTADFCGADDRFRFDGLFGWSFFDALNPNPSKFYGSYTEKPNAFALTFVGGAPGETWSYEDGGFGSVRSYRFTGKLPGGATRTYIVVNVR